MVDMSEFGVFGFEDSDRPPPGVAAARAAAGVKRTIKQTDFFGHPRADDAFRPEDWDPKIVGIRNNRKKVSDEDVERAIEHFEVHHPGLYGDVIFHIGASSVHNLQQVLEDRRGVLYQLLLEHKLRQSTEHDLAVADEAPSGPRLILPGASYVRGALVPKDASDAEIAAAAAAEIALSDEEEHAPKPKRTKREAAPKVPKAINRAHLSNQTAFRKLARRTLGYHPPPDATEEALREYDDTWEGTRAHFRETLSLPPLPADMTDRAYATYVRYEADAIGTIWAAEATAEWFYELSSTLKWTERVAEFRQTEMETIDDVVVVTLRPAMAMVYEPAPVADAGSMVMNGKAVWWGFDITDSAILNESNWRNMDQRYPCYLTGPQATTLIRTGHVDVTSYDEMAEQSVRVHVRLDMEDRLTAAMAAERRNIYQSFKRDTGEMDKATRPAAATREQAPASVALEESSQREADAIMRTLDHWQSDDKYAYLLPNSGFVYVIDRSNLRRAMDDAGSVHSFFGSATDHFKIKESSIKKEKGVPSMMPPALRGRFPRSRADIGLLTREEMYALGAVLGDKKPNVTRVNNFFLKEDLQAKSMPLPTDENYDNCVKPMRVYMRDLETKIHEQFNHRHALYLVESDFLPVAPASAPT